LFLIASDGLAVKRLCEAGRLYEVEAWIRAGRSLTDEHSQEANNDALRHPLFRDRPAFVELAVAHRADIASIPFLDVLLTGDRTVVVSFLERGADPIANYPFRRSLKFFNAKTAESRRNRTLSRRGC